LVKSHYARNNLIGCPPRILMPEMKMSSRSPASDDRKSITKNKKIRKHHFNTHHTTVINSILKLYKQTTTKHIQISSMQIFGLNQFLSTTPHPLQALAPKEQMYEISNRNSRRLEHVRKENDCGWKPNKHDVQKQRVKTHMENRGMSKRFGDAKRDAANRADF